MPLNHILSKCTGRYKLHKSQEKNQPFSVYGWHQTVGQKWKRIGNPNTGSENIHWWYRNGIWHRKMCHASNEKQKMTEGIELSNQGKIRMLGDKENYQYLGILEAGTIKQAEMKEKKKENHSKPNYIIEISSKG